MISIQGVLAIDISFSASNGGQSVSIWDTYLVDDSVSVSGTSSATFDNLGMTDSRNVFGSGDAYLRQRLQGSGGGDDWTASHLLVTSGSSGILDLSGVALGPTACDLARSINVYGTASVMVEGDAAQGPDSSGVTVALNGDGDADGTYSGSLIMSTGHSADVILNSKIEGAVIKNSPNDGIFSEAQGSGAANSIAVVDTTIQGATSSGVHVNTLDGGTSSLSIDGSTIDSSGLNGVWVANFGGTFGDLSVENSAIKSSGMNGVMVFNIGGDSGGLSIDGSTIENSLWNGVWVSTSGGTSGDLSIRDSAIKSSGMNGVSVSTPSSTTGFGDLSIEESTITGSTYGIYLSNYGAFGDLSIVGSTIKVSKIDGVYVSNGGSGTIGALSADLSNIYGNHRYGINNSAGKTFNAENNWWGPGGTGEPGAGGNNRAAVDVDFNPWSTTSFPEVP